MTFYVVGLIVAIGLGWIGGMLTHRQSNYFCRQCKGRLECHRCSWMLQ